MTSSPYTTLNIPESASEDEIKRAYRKLALKFHPDKNPGNKQAEEQFKSIASAYEILSDPTKKAYFDQYGIAPGDNSSGNGFGGGFGRGFYNGRDYRDTDLFKDFNYGEWIKKDKYTKNKKSQSNWNTYEKMFDFGSEFQEMYDNIFKNSGFSTAGWDMGSNHGSESGSNGVEHDIKQVVNLTLEELDNGTSKTFSYNKTVKCKTCNGQINNACYTCGSKGYTIERTTLKQIFPRGLKDGDIVKSENQGNWVSGYYKSGDIIITIKELPHSVFKRVNGYDLLMSKAISIPEAVLGTVLEIENLQKQKLSVKIASGTQSGIQLVLKAQGLTTKSEHGSKGNLQLNIYIDVPKDLTQEEIELYKKLDEINKGKVIIDCEI